jgi:hypothetical protein
MIILVERHAYAVSRLVYQDRKSRLRPAARSPPLTSSPGSSGADTREPSSHLLRLPLIMDISTRRLSSWDSG